MEVDHFDPKQKNDLIQDYANLFLATRHCNNKKRDSWPSAEEMKAGCRFLNPCCEMDYGEQIFEMPGAHLLVGMTVAAQWHIRTCGLNADHLINERALRARYLQQFANSPVLVKANPSVVVQLARSFKEEVEKMIPPIPPPPSK